MQVLNIKLILDVHIRVQKCLVMSGRLNFQNLYNVRKTEFGVHLHPQLRTYLIVSTYCSHLDVNSVPLGL